MVSDIQLKSLPPVTILRASAEAPDFDSIPPLVGPLFDQVESALEGAGIPVRDPALAIYEAATSDGGTVAVRAGFPAEPGDPPVEGVDLVEVESVPLAATIVHHGSMAGIRDSWMALMGWIEAEGYRPSAPGREVYLVAGQLPQDEWVTEIQQPVERAS